MSPVNVNRYARLLNLGMDETRNVLLKVLQQAGKVLQRRANILERTRDGYVVFGIPFNQYVNIWEADREELIDEPHQKALVKRMQQELNDIDPDSDSYNADQLSKLKSMSAQDMVRAGLWTRQPLKHELVEEVEEDF